MENSKGGKRHNLPKQRFINQGLFTVDESKFEIALVSSCAAWAAWMD